MSAWDEAARNAVAGAIAQCDEAQSVGAHTDAILTALAPHLAARDAAVWAQACETMRETLCELAERYRLPRNALGDMRAHRAPPPPDATP